MSKMLEMGSKFPNTQFWVDSCAKSDLEYGIGIGAVGATTNPVIVSQVLQKELKEWEPTIIALFKDNPTASEDEIAWKLIEQMAVRGCGMLYPQYEKSKGQNGKLSIQTNIKNYRNWEKMTEQAVYFNSLAENIMVKMPISEAGLKAFEEATYRGVSINATVSFSFSQAVALAEAVERGLLRREAEGLDNSHITPVCTIMIGRIDDWLKKAVARDSLAIMPEALEWAGIAVFKKAYAVFKERGYRTRLLTAAYRNIYAWSELIGGDLSMTIASKYLKIFDNSSIPVENNIDRPVPEEWMSELNKLDDFHRAYDDNGLRPDEFEHFGPFVTCLEGFFKGFDDLLKIIRPYGIGEPTK